MAKSRIVTLRIRANAAILDLMLKIAMDDFDGNLSQYVRELIYTDLLNRQVIDEVTKRLLEEQ